MWEIQVLRSMFCSSFSFQLEKMFVQSVHCNKCSICGWEYSQLWQYPRLGGSKHHHTSELCFPSAFLHEALRWDQEEPCRWHNCQVRYIALYLSQWVQVPLIVCISGKELFTRHAASAFQELGKIWKGILLVPHLVGHRWRCVFYIHCHQKHICSQLCISMLHLEEWEHDQLGILVPLLSNDSLRIWLA